MNNRNEGVTHEELQERKEGDIRPPDPKDVFESLDYEPIENEVSRAENICHPVRRHFYGYTGLTLTKYVMTIMIGALTGFIAFIMESSMKHGLHFKAECTAWALEAQGLGGGFAIHATISLSLVIFASGLVQFYSPESAGGGVTLVKAFLNGIHIPHLLSVRTLIAKIIGTTAGVLSSLAVGPEGPMVHIGACVAAVLTTPFQTSSFREELSTRHDRGHYPSKRQSKWFNSRLFVSLLSDVDQREFVSAGTAAGLAAAFGAPIGGVLFALEEASSFWNHKVTWRCFLCAASASFVLAFLHGTNTGLVSLEGLKNPSQVQWMQQTPFMIFVAGLSGLIGGIFNVLHSWLAAYRAPRSSPTAPIAEAVVICMVTVGCFFVLPYLFMSCQDRPHDWLEEEYGFRFLCEEGQYDEVATMFFSSSEETIKKILQMGEQTDGGYEDPFTRKSLCIFAGAYLMIMSLACGAAVPGGLFMPSIMLGSSFGAVMGSCLDMWWPNWHIQPGLYALIGATAVLGGVFRSTISIVVIVVEGTGGIEFVFTIIIAIVVSDWVASQVHHHGIYEGDLDRDMRLAFLQTEPPSPYSNITARDIMSKKVLGLRPLEKVSRILEVLRSSSHNGFPVFECVKSLDGDEPVVRRGALQGLILRSQLLVLLKHKQFVHKDAKLEPSSSSRHMSGDQDDGDSLEESGGVQPPSSRELVIDTEMRTFHHRWDAQERYRCKEASLLADYTCAAAGTSATSGSDRQLDHMMVDVSHYMNRSVLTVREECSAAKVYTIFRALGLRHMCVVDDLQHPVGMVTRKDLMCSHSEDD